MRSLPLCRPDLVNSLTGRQRSVRPGNAAISGRCSVRRVHPIPPYVRAMPPGILNDSLTHSRTGCDQILLRSPAAGRCFLFFNLTLSLLNSGLQVRILLGDPSRFSNFRSPVTVMLLDLIMITQQTNVTSANPAGNSRFSNCRSPVTVMLPPLITNQCRPHSDVELLDSSADHLCLTSPCLPSWSC